MLLIEIVGSSFDIDPNGPWIVLVLDFWHDEWQAEQLIDTAATTSFRPWEGKGKKLAQVNYPEKFTNIEDARRAVTTIASNLYGAILDGDMSRKTKCVKMSDNATHILSPKGQVMYRIVVVDEHQRLVYTAQFVKIVHRRQQSKRKQK